MLLNGVPILMLFISPLNISGEKQKQNKNNFIVFLETEIERFRHSLASNAYQQRGFFSNLSH